VARAIADAFAAYRDQFLEVTRRARVSFETRDWQQLRRDSKLRLGLYRQSVDEAEATTRALLGDRCLDRVVWVSAKAVYSSLIAQRQDWDLAETFFNSVTRRLFSTVGGDPCWRPSTSVTSLARHWPRWWRAACATFRSRRRGSISRGTPPWWLRGSSSSWHA
jgi:hypothetical protein